MSERQLVLVATRYLLASSTSSISTFVLTQTIVSTLISSTPCRKPTQRMLSSDSGILHFFSLWGKWSKFVVFDNLKIASLKALLP
jgi:hypothetical protein